MTFFKKRVFVVMNSFYIDNNFGYYEVLFFYT